MPVQSACAKWFEHEKFHLYKLLTF